MCIKTIYHNTYSDGARDVTERVETCTPGYLCAHPRIRDVDRTISAPKYSSSPSSGGGALAPPQAYYADVRPVSPMMTPPGSRGSDGSGSRRKSLYLDGNKIVEVRHERSPRRHERSPRRPAPGANLQDPSSRGTRVPLAPEPPAPHRTLPMAIPVAMKRASTMPWGTGLETPPERGRRPIIVEEPAPRTPRTGAPRLLASALPVGPVEVLEHASSGRRRTTRRDSELLLHPHSSRRVERSPQGYGSAEDDAERRERRRKRREARRSAAAMATSVPTFGNTDVYSSSYGSSRPHSPYDSSGASSPVVEQSPAVGAVKKTLRWEDQLRAEQNARIRSRPKLARAATSAGTAAAPATTPVQAEVKSILKKTGTPTPSPGTSPARGPRGDELAELYRSVQGMSLAQNAEKRAREAEAKDSEAYIDRLRGRFETPSNRFAMPPRRFTAGSGSRRRTEIWYPDEGRYKWM